MAETFNNNYNPDILSCIANLSNDEVFTPPEVANAMLDMLPQELFSNPDTKFLDPACKSGVFLREIAKRLLIGLKDTIPDLQQRVDHIFQHQLYGIAITELTSLLSRRSVYCSKYPNSKYSVTTFENTEGNIRFKHIKHSWKNGKCVFCGASQNEYGRNKELESYAYEFIHKVKPEDIFKMKFDVIISNPPYQISDGGAQASATPIYNLFVQQAKKLNPRYLVMIIPSRWFAGGKGLDEFRDNMINDTRVKYLRDFLNASDCFGNGIQIKGGVCYFLWDRDYKGMCTIETFSHTGLISKSTRYMKIENNDVFIRRNEAVSILEKVKNLKFESFSKLVSARRPFGLSTNIKGHTKQNSKDIKIYIRGTTNFISTNEITRNNDWINKYKIYITKAYGANDEWPHQVLNKPLFGNKSTCCSETYLVIGPFETISETKNIMSYIRTKFFRFLVSLKKVSQDATQKVYEFVPMQDFSRPWTDEELYKKYNLTDEEIAFIESMIKPMELGGDENGD